MSGVHFTREQYEALKRKWRPEPATVSRGNSGAGGSTRAQGATPKMSSTEKQFEVKFLADKVHSFQPFTIHMKNGRKYRPDFYVPLERTFIEVKGSYRLHSHGRSMLAFAQCRVEFPEFTWTLARKTKKEGWVFE